MREPPPVQKPHHTDQMENGRSSPSFFAERRRRQRATSRLTHMSREPCTCGHKGLPKTRTKAQKWENGRRPPSFYIERRRQHTAAGPTPSDPADNTKVLKRSFQGKWNRYCALTVTRCLLIVDWRVRLGSAVMNWNRSLVLPYRSWDQQTSRHCLAGLKRILKVL